jgi:hypothetical protein
MVTEDGTDTLAVLLDTVTVSALDASAASVTVHESEPAPVTDPLAHVRELSADVEAAASLGVMHPAAAAANAVQTSNARQPCVFFLDFVAEPTPGTKKHKRVRTFSTSCQCFVVRSTSLMRMTSVYRKTPEKVTRNHTNRWLLWFGLSERSGESTAAYARRSPRLRLAERRL